MDRTSAHKQRQARAKNIARAAARLRPALPCGCREEVQVYGQAAVRVMRVCRAHVEVEADPWELRRLQAA